MYVYIYMYMLCLYDTESHKIDTPPSRSQDIDRNVLFSSIADHGMWFDTWQGMSGIPYYTMSCHVIIYIYIYMYDSTVLTYQFIVSLLYYGVFYYTWYCIF